MNNELQQKLSQLIEANFSKMESEVLTRLVSEHDTLKTKNFEQEDKIKNYAKDLERLREELKIAEGAKETLRSDLSASRAKEKEATEAYDRMKKEFVEIELKCTKNSLDQIFRLTETAFKNPIKIRKFDMPVVDEYTSLYNGQGSANKTNRTMPVTETISEE
jgi:hypothetical protein